MSKPEPVFDNVMQALGAWWMREWPKAVLNADALIRLDAMIRDEVKPNPNDPLRAAFSEFYTYVYALEQGNPDYNEAFAAARATLGLPEEVSA